MKRVISGLAALGIALSGMALGTSSAWASDGANGPISASSTTINDTDQGTITISGGAVDHTFNGYRLGYLTSISYNQIESESFNSASMTGYTLETNSKYLTQIEAALDGITDTEATSAADKTLKERYLADNNYCGSECGATGNPNPLGWFFANYGGGYENEASWGGSKTGAASDATDASILRQFATRVSAAIDQMPPASTDVKELKSSEAGRSTDVKQGYYLLRDVTTIDAGSATKETQSAPILVSTTYKVTIGGTNVTFAKDGSTEENKVLGKVDLKNSTPTITKEVVTDVTGATAQAQPDYAVGDAVYYKLTATLPYYTGYAANATDPSKGRVYKITDTASKGLTVGGDAVVSVKVSKAGETDQTLAKSTDAQNADYAVTTVDASDTEGKYVGGQTTTIDFANYVNLADGTKSKENKILEGGTVTVIFKATLNNNALISDHDSPKGNPNKDSLTYSNQPEDVSKTHTTPGDEVNVYTYRFRLHKTNKAGEALPGATFHVSAPSDANKWLKWDTNKWTYVDENDATNFVSNDQGEVVATMGETTVNLDRLDSGTYTVKETKAPTGYTQAFLPTFTFTITPTVDGTNEAGHKTITDVTFSNAGGDGKAYVTDASAITAAGDNKDAWQYTIYNAKNLTELPMTGGAGLVAIIAVGVLLAGAGTAAAVRSRKSTSRAVRV